MIKGGNEIIRYNFFRNKFTYLKLNAPFIALEQDSYENLFFIGVLDLGDYLVKVKLNIENGKKSDFTLTVSKRYIMKEYLPKSQIIGCFPDDYAIIYGRQVEQAYFLHMADYIVAYSKERDRRLAFLKVKYGPREVAYYRGLLLAKHNSKKIYFVKAPCNFNDNSEYFSVYESSGLIKDFAQYSNPCRFYLVDEANHVKIVELKQVEEYFNRERLVIKGNYFVDKLFTGTSPYILSDTMVYEGFKGTILQSGQNKNEEAVTSYDLTFPNDSLAVGHPLISRNTIVFIGQKQHKVLSKTKALNDGVSRSKRQACIMPMFNTPVFSILSGRKREAIINEFFFKPPNSEEELIVYQLQSDVKQYVEFAFYRTNGQYVDSIKLTIPGVRDYKKHNVSLSPNGKFIFTIYPHVEEDNTERTETGLPVLAHNYSYKERRYDGKVYEIVALRKKSEIKLFEK